MRIALVFPPYKPKVFSENLSTVDEEFCSAPPIILAYVAAILERHGHQVMLLDARVLRLSKEKALERIRGFRPDMLGFRSETYHFHDSLKWIGYLKSHLGIPVFTGGVNISLYPEESLSHSEIDYGITGEAIEALPALLSALENNDSLKQISGIGYKDKDGTVIINPRSGKKIDFNDYPFPARHLLPNDKYYSFISQRKNFTVMLTSTGCPFKCTFCAIPNAYRTRIPKSVLDEIEVCYRDFGIREIDFFDAVLFMPKERVLEIFRQLQRRKLDIEWSCRSRVDVVDEDILKEASRAGCRQIYYGIESVNQKVLDKVKKSIEPERVRQAVKLSKKYGIRAMGFFMVGNPEDTTDSVRETIRFAKELDLDFIQVCRSIPKPGTDLDKEMIQTIGRDPWREHVLGNKIKERLPAPWSALTEKEKESLTKEFYLKFYFRPKILWNRVSQLRSIQELRRYIKVGLKMLFYRPRISSILTDTTEAKIFLDQSKRYLTEARQYNVAVVIPTYNEKDNIRKIIQAVTDVLPNAHIVVVDDNSPDKTGFIVEELSKQNNRIHLISKEGKSGLGPAYKDGFRFVLDRLDSDYIFEMDADLSHNPQYIPLFLHYARQYDLITGSRFLNKVSIKNRALWRNIISKTTKWFINIITGMQLSDVTTGFKCFHRTLLKKIDLDKIKSKGYAFQIEVSYAAESIGADIKEIPIFFVERTAGASKMSKGIMIEGIYLVLKLSLQRLKQVKNSFRKIIPAAKKV